MRPKSLTNPNKAEKQPKPRLKRFKTSEMLGKETKVRQKTITMKEVILEKLEEDASQEDETKELNYLRSNQRTSDS